MQSDTFGTITFRCDHPSGETAVMTVSWEVTAEELKEVFQRFMLAVGYHPDCVKEEDDDDGTPSAG